MSERQRKRKAAASDGVDYLLSKLHAPVAGTPSACCDITDLFDTRTGRCRTGKVVQRLRENKMWMIVPETSGALMAWESRVAEALEDLYMLHEGVSSQTHDALVERFDAVDQAMEEDPPMYESLLPSACPGGRHAPVSSVQWGDAADEVQKLSRRLWMLTPLGLEAVAEGKICFYASIHKENAARKLRVHSAPPASAKAADAAGVIGPDHKEFQRDCLQATFRHAANDQALLGALSSSY